MPLPEPLKSEMERMAARAAITEHSEKLPYGSAERERLTDDYHDLLNSVRYVLEAAGIPLPDPTSAETARTAWL